MVVSEEHFHGRETKMLSTLKQPNPILQTGGGGGGAFRPAPTLQSVEAMTTKFSDFS